MALVTPDAAGEQATVEAFISRWQGVTASELATAQSFANELCALLGVDPPSHRDDYRFERPVTFRHGDGGSSAGRIDCYKRDCFVLEAKKLKAGGATKGFDDALLRARAQAEGYARALPAEEGRPPFLIVVDVGNIIELYAEFSRTGATYVPFPDPRSHRIRLADLSQEAIRARLRSVWLDPLTLDPTRQSAKVTREIAVHLAEVAKSLESSGHAAETVAGFLTRCLFSMFAEDVQLLPKGSFTELLKSLADDPGQFVPLIGALWKEMDGGGFSVVLRKTLPQFNGKLFKNPEVLPLTKAQIVLLIEAAKSDWTQVEPAIFGTLLERALDPRERHSLGAHYTPRAYVDRLVQPTVVEPLRREWGNVQAAAVLLANEGRHKEAVAELRQFHHRLCSLRVLDPACGSGNFLYVSLEHIKRLEGEVLNQLHDLGESLSLETEGLTVDPHQFLGLEINPRAAAIAELVLWIGYLQWHFRTQGSALPPQPVLKDFKNIECRDAVLADGKPADWLQADFIVGNPPFIGASSMRAALGDAYTESLRAAWPEVPDSADLVMFWWHKAALLLAEGRVTRFGFITTNSLRQTFNRRVLERHFGKLHLAFAIPDHPWVESAGGAAVRIAMTVATAGAGEGRLLTVLEERDEGDEGLEVTLAEQTGVIHADLTIGANVTAAQAMQANESLTSRGLMLFGAGFIVTLTERATLEADAPIKDYRNGRDLTDRPRGVKLIDLFGFDADEVRRHWPATYQRVLTTVKPERDRNRDKAIRENWWLHGRSRPEIRAALVGLPRYIATVETAKHRVFQFLDASIAPDNKLICIALDNGYSLGVLSSRVHVVWALAQGSWLGVGNDPVYAKSRCFETFPFPTASPEQCVRIADLAEQIDAHRKRVLAAHEELTLTGLYNVFEALKAGRVQTAKEKAIHDKGLVAVLKSLHDDLDAAVLDAYGWHDNPDDEAMLERLVALNAERSAEEAQGVIRWLRPAFQTPRGSSSSVSTQIVFAENKPATISVAPVPWPKTLPEQMAALAAALTRAPQSEQHLADRFSGRGKSRLPELLATLSLLGRARRLEDGRWTEA